MSQLFRHIQIIFAGCLLVLISGVLLSNSQKKQSDYFIDPRDGRCYELVQVGDLTWFKENLQYETPRSVCYEQLQSNCEFYGRLYPFDEAQIACPENWQLPTEEHVNALYRQIKSFKIGNIAPSGEWLTKGGKKFNNSSNLSVLPAGKIDSFSVYSRERKKWLDTLAFHQLGTAASFWLSDVETAEGVMHWHVGEPIGERKGGMHRHPINKDEHKFSVRCVCENFSK